MYFRYEIMIEGYPSVKAMASSMPEAVKGVADLGVFKHLNVHPQLVEDISNWSPDFSQTNYVLRTFWDFNHLIRVLVKID